MKIIHEKMNEKFNKWQFIRKRSKSGDFQANFKMLHNADHTEAKRGR